MTACASQKILVEGLPGRHVVYQVAAVHIRDAKTHPRGPAWAQVGGAGCPWWVNTFVRGARARPTVWARAFLAARGPPSTRQENPWATPGPRADPAGWWAGPGCLYFPALADMRCTSSSGSRGVQRGVQRGMIHCTIISCSSYFNMDLPNAALGMTSWLGPRL